jgi:hypothetical protein
MSTGSVLQGVVMAEVQVPQRRRLIDLYTTGREVTMTDDGDGDPIVVYLSKLNDLEQKKCVEKSASARAKLLLMQKDRTDPGRDMYKEQLEAFEIADDTESLIRLIAAPQMAEIEQSIESRVAHEDIWTKNGLLDALREAWEGGLEDEFLKDMEHPDAKRVHGELLKFAQQVEEEVQAAYEDIAHSLRQRPHDDLMDEAVDRLLEVEGNARWIEEYVRWRLFYAVRDPENHRVKYFESRDEVDLLDSRVVDYLNELYEAMSVGGLEGKD